MFTRIGAFTFADSTRSSVHVIAMELTLSKEIQEAILAAREIMIRVITKNIDGILKNTYRFRSQAIKDIKKFIRLQEPN